MPQHGKGLMGWARTCGVVLGTGAPKARKGLQNAAYKGSVWDEPSWCPVPRSLKGALGPGTEVGETRALENEMRGAH